MLINERRNDFVEMMLHHVLTIVLYTAGYLINCVELGILVVYVHDWADMFGHFGKCFSETDFKAIQYLNAVTMWLGWLISRLIMFPITVYTGIFIVPPSKIEVWSGSDEELILNILGYFCLILYMLNIWWFYLITKMIYRFYTVGSTKDL